MFDTYVNVSLQSSFIFFCTKFVFSSEFTKNPSLWLRLHPMFIIVYLTRRCLWAARKANLLTWARRVCVCSNAKIILVLAENRPGPSNMGNLISQLLLCKTITPDFNLEELASINKDSEEIKGLLADMQEYMPQQQDSTSQGINPTNTLSSSLPCGAGANIRKYARTPEIDSHCGRALARLPSLAALTTHSRLQYCWIALSQLQIFHTGRAGLRPILYLARSHFPQEWILCFLICGCKYFRILKGTQSGQTIEKI